jgi:hypothetical protein
MRSVFVTAVFLAVAASIADAVRLRIPVGDGDKFRHQLTKVDINSCSGK